MSFRSLDKSSVTLASGADAGAAARRHRNPNTNVLLVIVAAFLFRAAKSAGALSRVTSCRRTSLRRRRPLGHGELHCPGLPRVSLMRGVYQRDRHLVLARGHVADVDGVAVARVGPQPRQV